MNKLQKLFVFILLFAASGISYSTECKKPVPFIGDWKELMDLSNEFSFHICIKVGGKSGAYVLSEKHADTIFLSWKSQALLSAIKLDKLMYGNKEVKQFQQLTKVFIKDVEKTLAPMLLVAGVEGDGVITKDTRLPVINAKEDTDPSKIGLLKVNTWTERGSGEANFKIKDVHIDKLNKQCKMLLSKPKGNYCVSYVKAWSKAISAYRNDLIKITPAHVSIASIKYSKDWEDFYSLSRGQTFIDTMYTSYRYREKLSGSAFVKAPDVQYFLLRPGVVMEYIEDAAEGDRFKEALSIEWYGFNYWRKCPYLLDNACGMSIVSTYSDRAGSDNQSLGLMFHYDNNLSLGIVRGTGNNKGSGIFVTIDLLKAMESKKERVSAWKKTINENISDFNMD